MATFGSRSVLSSARTATARFSAGLKPKTGGPSPFTRIPSLKPQQQLPSRIFRSPVELSSVSVVSMLPYHTATASALLTSLISVAPRTHGWSIEEIWVLFVIFPWISAHIVLLREAK